MSDRWVVALAVATWVGALASRSVPLAVAIGGVVLAAFADRPMLLCVAAAVLASALAARSLAGLDDPPIGHVRARVTLVSDPEHDRADLVAIARLHGRHVVLVVPSGLSRSDAVAAALAGESVEVDGIASALGRSERYLRVKHVAAHVDVTRVGTVGPASSIAATANALRRTIGHGAVAIPERHRPLFLGMLFGDTRGQRADIADDFRGAGLGHLLAVSGQNVAFVMVLLGPALRRLRIDTRLVVTLAAIAFFALATRLEPSVLRACTMAGVATIASTFGRHVSPLRALGLAVSALVLIDPLVVHALGFQLSVAAAAAIVTLAAPVSAALPGPRAVADALAVTLAAQVGVAPLLLAAFGAVPLASVPANLLAVPAAGLVMVWGLPVGLVAGLIGSTGAALLHTPTRLLLAWIATVAARSAAAPLGSLDIRAVVVLTVAVGALAAAHRLPAPAGALRAGSILAAGALVIAAARGPAPPLGYTEIAYGAQMWRAPGGVVVLVVSSNADAERLLAELRGRSVRSLDALALRGPVPDATVAAVVRRFPSAEVLRSGDRWAMGGVDVVVEPGRVAVRLEPRRSRRRRAVGSIRGARRGRSPSGADAGRSPVRHHDPGDHRRHRRRSRRCRCRSRSPASRCRGRRRTRGADARNPGASRRRAGARVG
jgi:competence protein ComEC